MAYLLGKSGNSGAIVNYDNYYDSAIIKKLKSPQINIEKLFNSTHAMGTGTIGNYGLFAGGTNDDYYVSTVTAYSDTLVRHLPANLSIGRYHILSSELSTGVVFLGGYAENGVASSLEMYDNFLSKVVTLTTYDGRAQGASKTIDDKAIFAGGVSTNNIRTSSVEVYNSSLIRLNAPTLSDSRSHMGSAKVGDYVIFVGGENQNGIPSNAVEAYSKSLVKTILPNMHYGISGMKGVELPSFALFAGGINEYGNNETTTLAYNSSLTKVTSSSLNDNRFNHTAQNLNGNAVFFGGKNVNVISTVEGFDNNLVRTFYPDLNVKKVEPGSVKVGNYIIVGGGKLENDLNSTDTVDVYSSDFITHVAIPKDSKYKLNSDSEETANSNKLLRFDAKVNGYVKYKNGTITR